MPDRSLPRQGANTLTSEMGSTKERLALVLDISRAAASLDLPALVDRVASCLKRSRWNADHIISLCFYEPAENALRVHHLVSRPSPIDRIIDAKYRDGLLVPIEGSQSGLAFTTGQPCVANTRAEYAALMSPAWSAGARTWAAEAFKLLPPAYSGCAIPLICRGRTLGTLGSSCAREGAFDDAAVRLLSQIADVIAPAVSNALAYREIEELKDRLAKENRYLKSEISASFGEIVGQSQALKRVLALVESVARTTSPVLIHGETGTGKDLVAHAIHRLSERRGSTFVKVNCAAIPGGLLESDLFGHEKGAFTGAASQKAGRFELAHQGTLFLDEIGEIPRDLQPKLLRVLQDQEFERLGGTRTIKVDARVIAATNRDLTQMRADGSFRSDLFYRLNVFPILVPPLRERREDVPLLVRYFVASSAKRLSKVITEIPADTLDTLSQYDWPGNVRELANMIERAVILSRGPVLRVHTADIEDAIATANRTPATDRAAQEAPHRLVDVERAAIKRALEDANWVVGGRFGAATRLGLSRTTLQARMRRLGISRPK